MLCFLVVKRNTKSCLVNACPCFVWVCVSQTVQGKKETCLQDMLIQDFLKVPFSKSLSRCNGIGLQFWLQLFLNTHAKRKKILIAINLVHSAHAECTQYKEITAFNSHVDIPRQLRYTILIPVACGYSLSINCRNKLI